MCRRLRGSSNVSVRSMFELSLPKLTDLMKSRFLRITPNFSILLCSAPYNSILSSVTSDNNMEVDSSASEAEAVNVNETQSVIKENTTEILIRQGKKVFYNPVQEFNRDLSVLAIQVHSKQFIAANQENDKNSQKGYRILEALSATGLRSIRYAKEVSGVTEVIANDISNEAVENIKTNVKHNNVEHIVTPSLSDAIIFMISNNRLANRFQVVDLDPYGSPTIFLDSAVQCVADGGLLLVTCTDMSVLCGLYPETCYAKYGALSLSIQGKHEMGIRIVLQHIQSHASRYKRYIVPLLSVSVDFYIRIFVKVFTGAAACKNVISKLSMVHECCGCSAIILQPLGVVKKGENDKNVKYVLPHLPKLGGTCTHCGGAQRMGGPIWSGPIHDNSFVAEMLKSIETNAFATSKRLTGILTVIQEELADVPLYYKISELSSKIKSTTIPSKILRSGILNGGYRVSLSHAAKESIKTDAPMDFIWDLCKSWLNENSPDEKLPVPGSPAEKILKSPIRHRVDFSLRPDAIPESVRTRLVRFQVNPFPNWGPGCKGTVKNLEKEGATEKKHSLPHNENASKKSKN